MDRHVLALMIPIMALAIPVVAIVIGGMIKMRKMRLEEARVRAGDLGVDPRDVAELREELDQVRGELADVHERLDFTERILARPRPADTGPLESERTPT